ncbi:MAG: dephospho-CoA kinase [Clostridia bacterium]|nr:dephospho-CoA kinase [Clostridia bacterium]
MKKIIGLTGPTGSGKSTFGRVAEKVGIRVINCDAVAKAVSQKAEIMAALAKQFGQDIIKDGALLRPLLAERAFSSPDNTENLNKIMLPAVVNEIKSMLGDDTVILDAPTLYESGLDSECDTVVAVLASEKLRKERITERDSLTDKAAKRRLSAAKPDSFFEGRADYVIYNDGDEQEFITKTIALLREITEEN